MRMKGETMYKNFEEIEKAYYGFWYTEHPKHNKAIELAEDAYKKFPEHQEQIIMDLIVFYGSLGEVTRCKKMMHLAYDKGLWYPAEYFSKFWQDDVYQEERKIYNRLKEAAAKAEVKYQVYLPDGYDLNVDYPLFISLHGWGENLKMFTDFWHSKKITSDFIHVSIQSSDQIGGSHYQWGEPERAKREILTVIDAIKKDYKLTKFVLMGGFSEGSSIAMECALDHSDLISGFVALNPNRPRNYSEDLMQAARENGLRGAIITGDQDQSYPVQKTLIQDFSDERLPCLFRVKKNFGHWFPDDLSDRIDEAIIYILKGAL